MRVVLTRSTGSCLMDALAVHFGNLGLANDDAGGPPFACAICGIDAMSSAAQLADHLAGRRHRAAAGDHGTAVLTCDLCNVRATSRSDLANHLRGKRHGSKLREFAERAEQALDDLATLNRWLAKLRLPEEDNTAHARAALKLVHINIFDLVEERFEPIFPSVKELFAYSKKNKKFFPRATAKSGGVLKLFLRVMFGRGRAAD